MNNSNFNFQSLDKITNLSPIVYIDDYPRSKTVIVSK